MPLRSVTFYTCVLTLCGEVQILQWMLIGCAKRERMNLASSLILKVGSNLVYFRESNNPFSGWHGSFFYTRRAIHSAYVCMRT